MEKSLSKKEKKEFVYNGAFADEEFIILRKVDFQQGISTLLYNAWKHRNSESHLYALYNYIQTLQSLTLRHKTEAARVIAPWPQPLFGTLEPPEGETNYPPRDPTLPGNFYPDHARIMIFGSKEQGIWYSLQSQISAPFDSSEAKVLNTKTEWNLEGCEIAAKKVIQSNLKQVLDSSLAGLAHNPYWSSLYAFLLVGPYFSLFAWKTRPDAEHLRSLPTIPIIPQSGISSKEKKRLTTNQEEVIKQRIERIKKTPLPEVIYFNEPMFTFQEIQGQKWYDRATLHPKYLHALSLPTLASSGELVCQPSWFNHSRSFNKSKRVEIRTDAGLQYIKEVINSRVQDEMTSPDLSSDKPDPTLRGPKPPDSSDSQQSCFSETEPQVVDPNAVPHRMKTRASTQEDEDAGPGIDADLLE